MNDGLSIASCYQQMEQQASGQDFVERLSQGSQKLEGFDMEGAFEILS